ncbi:MAG TPA: asparagine synthase-related protein [Paludibacteraceae bacterium]|nr:asparagine synthase-related protein [Paludibacteraceae bacterium]
MHGFNVLISKKAIKQQPHFCWKKPFDFQQNLALRTFSDEHIVVEQFTGTKFISEKLWLDNEDFFIVTDGVITNLKALCLEHNAANYDALLRKIVKEQSFFKNFRGHFVGFVYFKKEKTCIAFNNHTASKKLFYFADQNTIVIGTDLYTLSKTLETEKIKRTLDKEAAVFLLTSGFMHENLTLLEEVKQLRAGEFLQIDNFNLKTDFYFHLQDIQENHDAKSDIVEQLDFLFKKSIDNEFSLDKEHQLISLTTLSGGLDSRMVALTALQLGFSNQMFLNFSAKGYADEIIARQISEQYQVPLETFSIEAESLKPLEEVVLVNDGLTIYTGASAVFDAIKRHRITNTGMIHTGMLGDALLGSYLISDHKTKPQISDGVYSTKLLNKYAPVFQKYIQNYSDIEMYKFYNRGFSGMNNGFLYFDLCGESDAAFLNPDFLSYALSIPAKYRYKEQIYIDWIKIKHPEFAGFTWESIGGKPTNNSILRCYYRYRRALVKRMPFQTMWKNNMNPEQLWYDKNLSLRQTLDQYFLENIHLLSSCSDLFDDCQFLYKKGNITEKAQVLTLLAACKLLL